MNKFFRIIPTLLLKDGGLVKTIKFKDPRYIGDPINIVKLFNDKEADELCLIDISATTQNKEPNYRHLKEIVSEAFMPIGYGGGIRDLRQIEKLFKLGIEKVIINNSSYIDTDLISEASEQFGSQSIVVSIDIKRNILGKFKLYRFSGSKKVGINLEDHIRRIEDSGAGEIILNSINNDGCMEGYELELIKKVNPITNLPVILLGGAGKKQDLIDGINAGASGVSAGSLFIYQGIHKAVLVSYIKNEDLFN